MLALKSCQILSRKNRKELIKRYVGKMDALNVIKQITFEEPCVLFDKPVNLLRDKKTQEVINATYKIGNQEITLYFIKEICSGWSG